MSTPPTVASAIAEALEASHEAGAYLLPRDAYTSEEWFDAEQDLIFGKSWTYAGLESDLRGAGDYVTVQAGRHPLFVIKSGDGSLYAHYNICRHRGARLLQEGKGNASKGVSCFYHRWHYELDGKLRGVTNGEKFPCIDKNRLGLKRASLASWNGMVFVHAEEAPEQSLSEWLASFPSHHGPWNPSTLTEIYSADHELKANWKLFVENHVDGYHLFHLHARSIEGLDHEQQQWTACGRHWSFTEPVSVPGQLPEQLRASAFRLPRIPGVGPERDGSTVHLIFPGLALAGGATYYVMLQLIPRSASRTTIRTRLLGMKPDLVSMVSSGNFLAQLAFRKLTGKPDYEVTASPSNADGDFLGEDIFAAEAIQSSMASDQFEVGPLARDYENSITFFQRVVIESLRGGLNRQP